MARNTFPNTQKLYSLHLPQNHNHHLSTPCPGWQRKHNVILLAVAYPRGKSRAGNYTTQASPSIQMANSSRRTGKLTSSTLTYQARSSSRNQRCYLQETKLQWLM